MNSEKNTLIKDAVKLFVITLIAALALGAVYEITRQPIAYAAEGRRLEAARTVFPEMQEMRECGITPEELQSEVISVNPQYENVTVDDVLLACDGEGNCLGYILTMNSSAGYGGDITIMMGVASDGILYGIDFISISETAGLGMKAKDEEFKTQFRGADTDSFSLKKRDISGTTEVDAISSATVTTAAVTRMVNAGLSVAEKLNGAAGV